VIAGFPTVYSPTINRPDRAEFMLSQSKKYNINIKLFPTEYLALNREKYKVIGKYAGSDKQKDIKIFFDAWMSYATFISYIQCMRDWFYKTDEEYLIVCDDDTDFSSIDYWNFSWIEFFSLLPPELQCLQLIRMRGDIHDKLSEIPIESIINQQRSIIERLNLNEVSSETINFKIVERGMFHFNVGGGAFLLKREYVNRLLNQYTKGDTYLIDIKTPNEFLHLIKDDVVPPQLELSVVSLAKTRESFNFPLFTENCNLYTYFQDPKNKKIIKSTYWEYCKQTNSLYYNIFWEHVYKHTTLEKMMYNTGLNYDIVAPNEIWTRFPDPVRRQMGSNS